MGNIFKGETNENYEPTEDEIIKYGIWLGLTLPDDEDLLYLAWKNLKSPLPHQWKLWETTEGEIYYFNFKTGLSQQEHPYDSHYKQIVREAKRLKWLRKAKPICLLNYQIGITDDFNSKLKETNNTLSIDNLRNKTAEILSRPSNSELEMDFRAKCSTYQTNFDLHDPLLKQAYQDYLKAYQQNTSLYTLINDSKHYRSKLEIYNTETETKESKILKKYVDLSGTISITQVPNGKLFCYGYFSNKGKTMLIDMNGGIEVLPSGVSICFTSCIYSNNSVYCFGVDEADYFPLAQRFDLDRKRWIKLTPMPCGDRMCSSIVFNGNILICGGWSDNLWLYSIDIDSYSIPYKFNRIRDRILINAERLYLIECGGSIYESEIGSYTDWRQLANSEIWLECDQVYCLYNKGTIYIRIKDHRADITNYYKFDLNKKLFIRL